MNSIKTSRVYVAVGHPGQERFAFAVIRGNPLLPNSTLPFDEKRKLSSVQVAAWFKQHNIPASEEEIAEFAAALNFMMATVHPRDAVPASYAGQRVVKAVGSLEKDIPELIREMTLLVNQSKSVGSPLELQSMRENKLAELEIFEHAVSRISSSLDKGTPPVNHKFQGWHDDALCLALMLHQILFRQNLQSSFKSPVSDVIKLLTQALNYAVPPERSGGRVVLRKGDTVRNALSHHPHRSLIGIS